jgi:hypothetical protein
MKVAYILIASTEVHQNEESTGMHVLVATNVNHLHSTACQV